MAAQLGWIGPLVKGLFSIGNTYENAATAQGYAKQAKQAMNQTIPIGNELSNWGAQDWNNYKTTYVPAEDAVVARANEGFQPQTERVTGKAAAGDQAQLSDVVDSTNTRMAARGINPSSGASVAANVALNDAGAAKTGTDINLARTNEQNRVNDANWQNRLGLVYGAKAMKPQNASMLARGADMLNVNTRRAAGLSDSYSTAATSGLTDVGRSAGQGAGYAYDWWKSRPQISPGTGGDGSYDTPPTDKGSLLTNTPSEDDTNKADGGLIVGPGDGTSDSIPAVIDGEQPAAVSNGEYRIPAHVVAKIGRDKLDAIKAKYHKPVIESKAHHIHYAANGL